MDHLHARWLPDLCFKLVLKIQGRGLTRDACAHASATCVTWMGRWRSTSSLWKPANIFYSMELSIFGGRSWLFSGFLNPLSQGWAALKEYTFTIWWNHSEVTKLTPKLLLSNLPLAYSHGHGLISILKYKLEESKIVWPCDLQFTMNPAGNRGGNGPFIRHINKDQAHFHDARVRTHTQSHSGLEQMNFPSIEKSKTIHPTFYAARPRQPASRPLLYHPENGAQPHHARSLLDHPLSAPVFQEERGERGGRNSPSPFKKNPLKGHKTCHLHFNGDTCVTWS